MTKSKPSTSSTAKILFFGNERLATATSTEVPLLQALIGAGYEIEAVITNHTDAVSRQKRELEIGLLAQEHNIPVILLGDKIPLVEKVKKHQTTAAVLAAFGKIIPQDVIDLFPAGIINTHPSLLPKYRGTTPIETAILNGDTETGVSLMRLTAEMDAGPIYAQATLKLTGNETKQALADKLGLLAADLLINNLPDILSGALQPQPQAESHATYTKMMAKADGWLDFKEPAEAVERKVRAYLGYPKTRAKIHGHEIVITKARVARNLGDGQLVIECQPGFIEIEELIAPSGRTMSGADFLRGYSSNN